MHKVLVMVICASCGGARRALAVVRHVRHLWRGGTECRGGCAVFIIIGVGGGTSCPVGYRLPSLCTASSLVTVLRLAPAAAAPVVALPAAALEPAAAAAAPSAPAATQGLTLVHCSAQRKRFLWDRGCIRGLFVGYLGGVVGY